MAAMMAGANAHCKGEVLHAHAAWQEKP